MKVTRKNAAIKEERLCRECGKAFFEYPKLRHNYCSKTCCYAARVGKPHSNGTNFRREQADLLKRKPSEWKEMIDRYFEDLMTRRAIACVVFWDYFGRREVINRWEELDEYIEPHVNTTSNQRIRNGLIMLGYTQENAYLRIGD